MSRTAGPDANVTTKMNSTVYLYEKYTCGCSYKVVVSEKSLHSSLVHYESQGSYNTCHTVGGDTPIIPCVLVLYICACL